VAGGSKLEQRARHAVPLPILEDVCGVASWGAASSAPTGHGFRWEVSEKAGEASLAQRQGGGEPPHSQTSLAARQPRAVAQWRCAAVG